MLARADAAMRAQRGARTHKFCLNFNLPFFSRNTRDTRAAATNELIWSRPPARIRPHPWQAGLPRRTIGLRAPSTRVVGPGSIGTILGSQRYASGSRIRRRFAPALIGLLEKADEIHAPCLATPDAGHVDAAAADALSRGASAGASCPGGARWRRGRRCCARQHHQQR